MLVFVALCAAIGIPSHLAGVAYRSGNAMLLGGCLAILIPALIALIYLFVPQWGGKFQDRVVQRLYAGEGDVAFHIPDDRPSAGFE